MSRIETIRKKMRSREYEFAIPHFSDEMSNDDLTFADVEAALANGRIIRRFTHDPRGTRYEVIGRALDGRLIAVVCRIKLNGKLLLITTYALDEL